MDADVLKEISRHLIQGDEDEVLDLTRAAIRGKIAPKEILDRGLIAGMDVVGERFRRHEIFLPEVLLAARAMIAALDEIKPLLAQTGVEGRGKVVLGTVRGDLHDIGKNLVGIMLRGAGFDVIDLGTDVAPARFLDAARESGAAVIGMSTLLTTTMPVMREVVGLVREQGLAGEVRIVVGGAPLNALYAREIGADGYAYDAASAVERVAELVR